MYTIKNVSMMTGIGVHTLRAWEKRYSVIVPERSPSGRRFYSDENVEKLKLITILNKTGIQISVIAKLSLEELKQSVSNLSEKDLYPDEVNKLESSLFILKKAFEFEVQDILFHEFESMMTELDKDTYRLKALLDQLLIPFYEHVVSKDESNPSLRVTCRTVYSLISNNLKTVLAQLVDEFQESKEHNIEGLTSDDGPILVGSSGTVRGEIDSLICCIKSYLSGKEAIFIGSLVDKDTITEFIDHMPPKKVVITDRYVSFRAHPRLFDLMKDLPKEKLDGVEFAVLLHRFNELQELKFQNSDKVELLNNFDSMDTYFSAS